jgi:diadenosine tetraphosphate (Ap4A) HIT family hydrolase
MVSSDLVSEHDVRALMNESDPVQFSRKHRPLFEGEHWKVLLYRNQSYLGRSVVYLKTRKLEDPLDLTEAEREELWSDILPRLVRALGECFQPDRINYAHLTNRVRQVHWHIVPRYETDSTRKFAGHTFVDRRVGKIFRTKRFRLPDEVLDQICAYVKAHLD